VYLPLSQTSKNVIFFFFFSFFFYKVAEQEGRRGPVGDVVVGFVGTSRMGEVVGKREYSTKMFIYRYM
jgi:hypothetical protein